MKKPTKKLNVKKEKVARLTVESDAKAGVIKTTDTGTFYDKCTLSTDPLSCQQKTK